MKALFILASAMALAATAVGIGHAAEVAVCPMDAAQAAAQAPGKPLQAGDIQLRWALADEPRIRVGNAFALKVQVCPVDAALQRVDATMPEHRHGMNYRVSITPLGRAQYSAKGLLFHMPGRWELRFDVTRNGKTEKLTQSIEVP